ncbi:hypothetical protein [Sulfobacillus thermosulfidooxidans]|nr:hypothetical protein [Sulfobacillus thermosulfidooxidans]
MSSEKIWGYPFWIFVLALLWWPLTDEGQYWITAATGIVLGLFMLGLGLTTLKFFARKKHSVVVWILAFLTFLAADLCYEQYWFSQFVLVFIIAWHYRKAFWPVVLSPASALLLTAAWYERHVPGMVANGKEANHSLGAVLHSFQAIVPQIQYIWTTEQFSAWREGLRWSHVPAMWLVVVIILSLIFSLFVVSWNYTKPHEIGEMSVHPLALAGAGIIWIVLSYMPWLFTHYVWVADRSVTVAAIGIGLLAEALLVILRPFNVHRIGRMMSMVGLSAFLVTVIVLRGQDIAAYDAANAFSAQIGQVVLKTLQQHQVTKGVIVVKNSTWTFAPWTYTYHDHITTVWNAKLGTHYMLEDLSQGHAHYHVVPLWPGDLVTSVTIPKATAVILTTKMPSSALIAQLGVRHGVVIQYRDVFPQPHIVRTEWFSLMPEHH